MSDAELTEALKGRALEVGFERAGVARVTPLDPEAEHLRAWLAEGRHGEMGWMEDTAQVRADPAHPGMVEGARSILVLAAPYARTPESVGPSPGRVARYARGRDYHNLLTRRLRKLVKFLREQGHEARHSVDTRPVLERAWAERAGLGFVGKNCCLIVPGVGSHLFLACVVTTAELTPDAPMTPRCGSCSLCLDACPTRAFVGERELDARRCISYLTIETKGEVGVELRASMGDWIFGCDACQDICPYNRTSLPSEDITRPFAPHPRWREVDAVGLLTMDEERFRAWAEGSPIKRAGVDGMARNAAIVLGNRGGVEHLQALDDAAATHADSAVRETAAWAAREIRARR